MVLNIVAAFFLLATWFNQWISPYQCWWLSFLALGFPYLIIINCLFIAFWLVQIRWWFILSLSIILLNFKNIQHSVAWATEKPFSSNDSSIIKVMSFNVRVFDLYEYDLKQNHLEQMLATIKKEHPHIICIQEFFSSEANNHLKPYNTVKRLTEKAGYKYFHFYNSSTLRKTDHWGMAIFSDYEIKESADIDFGIYTENAACYCDIKIKDKIYRIINTHLQSVYFGRKDYQYLDNLKLEDDADVNAGKRILRKLKRGFIRRAEQAEMVAKIIAESPYEVILCSDFNDTPASYAYHTIGENLQDNFLEAGKGIGTSFISKFPFLRIDYIMCDKKLQVMKFKTMNEKILSDHYPIISWIKLN